MPLLLVTNDDGVSSPGIQSLVSELGSIGEVYVVAPESEQSAVARSLTLHRPLRVREIGANIYAVNGTPTDCVIVGVNKILPQKPNILVSGINVGANLGDNITYSGTVAAAMEGTLLGIPSLAVSLVIRYNGDEVLRDMTDRFSRAAPHAKRIIEIVREKGFPQNTLLNVNIPDTDVVLGIRITKQGKLAYDNALKDIRDPWGRECFWIGGGTPQWEPGGNTDLDAVHSGYISVTPVHLDLTNYNAMKFLNERWGIC